MRFILLVLAALSMASGADSAAIMKKVGALVISEAEKDYKAAIVQCNFLSPGVQQWHFEAGKARQAMTVEGRFAMTGKVK